MVDLSTDLPFEFFTVYTELAEMALLASKYLTTANKLKSSPTNKFFGPVGLDLMQEIITGSRIQCLTN